MRLTFISIFLFLSSAFAVGQPDPDLVCKIANTGKQCDFSKNQLFQAGLEAMKSDCQLKLKTCAGIDKSKMRNCSDTDVCAPPVDLKTNLFEGCKGAFQAFGKKALGTVEGMRKTAACNSSLSEKTKMFTDYNQTVPKFMRRNPIPDGSLSEMTCAEVDRVLSGFSQNIQRVYADKLRAFEVQHPDQIRRIEEGLIKDPNSLKTLKPNEVELLQFKDWMDDNGEKDYASLVKDATSLSHVPQWVAHIPIAAQQLLKDLGVDLYCYDNRARAELVCDAAIVAVESAAGLATGSGALQASKYLLILADASGSTKVAAAVLAMKKQEAATKALISAKRAGEGEETIVKLTDEADKLKQKALSRSSLLDRGGDLGERQRVAEIMVNDGRALTLAQKEGLESAHKVGQGGKDGYTPSEIQEKKTILETSGFTNAQAKRLIRNGIAGDFGMDTAEALKALNLPLRDPTTMTLSNLRDDVVKTLMRASRAYGTENESAAKAAVDHQLQQIDVMNARMKNNAVAAGEINQDKQELLYLKYFGKTDIAKASPDDLRAVAKSLRVRLKASGEYSGFGTPPPELKAEKDLLTKVEKDLESRPEVVRERQRSLEAAGQEHRASLKAQEAKERAAQTDPAAHSLKPEQRSEIHAAIVKLNDNPASLTEGEMKELSSLREQVKKKQEWVKDGIAGMTAEDQAVADQFASAWNHAADTMKRKQGSVEQLAAEQHRTFKPATVDRNQVDSFGHQGRPSLINSHGARIASSDEDKIAADLKKSHSGQSLPNSGLSRYQPVITTGSEMDSLAAKLKTLNVSPSELRSANALTTLEVSSLGRSGQAFVEAKALLEKLSVAQSNGSMRTIAQTLTPGEIQTMRNLIKTIQFQTENYVPDHLILEPFH